MKLLTIRLAAIGLAAALALSAGAPAAANGTVAAKAPRHAAKPYRHRGLARGIIPWVPTGASAGPVATWLYVPPYPGLFSDPHYVAPSIVYAPVPIPVPVFVPAPLYVEPGFLGPYAR